MMSWSTDDEDDLQDWEYPDLDDDDGDEPETIDCPNCSADVYDDAEQCPACGHYILAAESTKPVTMTHWVWWGMIVLFLTSVLLWGILQG